MRFLQGEVVPRRDLAGDAEALQSTTRWNVLRPRSRFGLVFSREARESGETPGASGQRSRPVASRRAAGAQFQI